MVTPDIQKGKQRTTMLERGIFAHSDSVGSLKLGLLE